MSNARCICRNHQCLAVIKFSRFPQGRDSQHLIGHSVACQFLIPRAAKVCCSGLNRAGEPHIRHSPQAIPGSDNDMPGVCSAQILHSAENKKEKREKRKRGSAFSGGHGRRGVTRSLFSILNTSFLPFVAVLGSVGRLGFRRGRPPCRPSVGRDADRYRSFWTEPSP